MVTIIDRLRKEWPAIKAAPFSFAIVCIIATGVCVAGLQWYYHEKISDSDKQAAQWKSAADYWKDVASRPKPTQECPSPESQSKSSAKENKPSATLSKREISKANEVVRQEPAATVINAPQGIGISGGNVTNPTVNNYEAPAAILSYVEEVIEANSERKLTRVHITTNRKIPGATIGILFSGPVELQENGLTIAGEMQKSLSWGQLVPLNELPAIPNPNSVGISINTPAAFLPGHDLIVPVKSKSDVHVSQVFQVTNWISHN